MRCSAEDKAAAREAAVAAAQEGFGGRPVRDPGQPVAARLHYGEDVVAVRRARADFVVLAKAESAEAGARCGLADAASRCWR